MDTSVTQPIRLLDCFYLHRHAGLQTRTGNGEWQQVPLGSRAIEVLGVLVAQRGELVSKDDLMSAVWPGTMVEEHNLTVQIAALRRTLDGGRSGKSCIQTVPGRGYRFVGRIEDAPTPDVPEPPSEPVAPLPANHPATRWRAIAAACTTLLLVLLIIASQRAGDPPPPPRLSLAVLPFANLGTDRADDVLAASFRDDIATDLTRIPSVIVSGRKGSFGPGRAVDPRKLGAELGVRYVAEGSLLRGSGVLRVNVRMTATETGTQLWADRFEQPLTDGNMKLEAMVRRIARSLNAALSDAESARSLRERPDHPDALDLVIRVRARATHTQSPQDQAEMLRLSEQAVRLDPRNIAALIQYGFALARLTQRSMGDEIPLAAKVIADAGAVAPNHPDVLELMAYFLGAQGRFADATAAYQRLLNEYPTSHFAWAEMAGFAVYEGHSGRAIELVEKAIGSDPTGPAISSYYGIRSLAHLMLGQDEETIVWTRRALAANPANRLWIRANFNIRMAAAHARLGKLDEARSDIAEANRIWPHDTVRLHWPDDPDSPVYAAQVTKFQDALRLAGHRDHADEDADFGVPPDDTLHVELGGWTPLTMQGATTIRTPALQTLLAEEHPIVIDPLTYSWGRSIPGAVGLRNAGFGSPYSNSLQDRLRIKMQALTAGNLSAPIVAVGFNSEHFDGHNLARRLVELGYRRVYWYRGGRESWEAAGLPESKIEAQVW